MKAMKIEWDDDESERDQKRQDFVESAASLFCEKGFKDTRLNDISASSQRGKTALYYYFKNKKSIFAAVVDWEISRIYEEIENAVLAIMQAESNSHFMEHFLSILDCYVEKVIEVGTKLLHKYRIILREYYSFEKLLQSVIRAFKEQNMILLKDILRYGQEHGCLILSDEGLDLLAYAIFRLCFTYYSDRIQNIDFQVGALELKKIIHLILGQQDQAAANG